MTRIGLGSELSEAEFNRRAAKAIRPLLLPNSTGFLQTIAGMIDRGATLSPDQQKAFVTAVHRHRKDITDYAVRDYAATHARGHDQ